MENPLCSAITKLSSAESSTRVVGATEIYRAGRTPADQVVHAWWTNDEIYSLLFGSNSSATVGLAVRPETFEKIREANGSPRLARVPPDQDAEEFELHFPNGILLDVLTTKDSSGSGAIAKYLSKFGEGVQQVEYRCKNVDRATAILEKDFGVSPVYPATRPGADGTRVNFFLVASPEERKILIELYETPSGNASP
ncbi:MAG: hypothetical protein ACHQLQ_00550 [Candidatus Acidiferrales bacterium]